MIIVLLVLVGLLTIVNGISSGLLESKTKGGTGKMLMLVGLILGTASVIIIAGLP